MTETNAQQTESLSIEDLSKKIQEATQELNQLKNGLNNLSLQEKSDRLTELEASIIDCSENLAELEADSEISIDKNELESLRTKIVTLESDKELLKKQIETQAKAEIDVLSQSVAQQENQQERGSQENGTEKKWLGRQRDAITSKQEWKEHTGKNILRTVGGVGAVAGIRQLGKRIFGGKDKEEVSETKTKESKKLSRKERREQRRKKRAERRKERAERRANRPWRKKFLIGSAVAGGAVVGGVQIYKNWNRIKSWAKEKLGKSLNFEESLASVEAEVYNGIHKEDNFGKVGAHFEGIHFNEETSEIESFGEITKIDYKKKTIYTPDGEGIGKVQFSDRKELLHAVNIVNFAKRALKGRARNPKPFTVSSVGGNIDFEGTEFMGASGSNFWTYLLGGVGAVGGGLLGGYCAGIKGAAIGAVGGGLAGYVGGSVIDNESTMNNICPTIKKGANLHLFVNYLNDQKKADGASLWESVGEQETQPDNTTPIHTYLNKLIKEIDLSYGSEDSDRRNLEAEMDKNDPTIYTIKSYNQAVKIKLEGCTAKPGEIGVDFSHITNMKILKYDEKDKFEGLNIDFPHNEEGLTELIRTANLTNKLREDFKGEGKEQYPFHYTSGGGNGITESLKISVDRTRRNPSGLTEILSKETCKNKFPTLFEDLKKYSQAGSFWNGTTQKNLHDQAVRNSDTGSQYIKYLHQMGNGRYWENVG